MAGGTKGGQHRGREKTGSPVLRHFRIERCQLGQPAPEHQHLGVQDIHQIGQCLSQLLTMQSEGLLRCPIPLFRGLYNALARLRGGRR